MNKPASPAPHHDTPGSAKARQAVDTDAVLALRDIHKSYTTVRGQLDILMGADMAIRRGECVALIAPSGAGKSTLLHIAGLLDRPSSGEVFLQDQACNGMNDTKRTALRRHTVGFVYQFHHLLPEFSALENVMLPQMIAGVSRKVARARANELLAYLKVDARAGHRPAELSGGEQQRVAVARAVANAPAVLLADEPTGNLDPETADHVFGALMQLVASAGLAALVATHNLDMAERMDRVVTLRRGRLYPVNGNEE